MNESKSQVIPKDCSCPMLVGGYLNHEPNCYFAIHTKTKLRSTMGMDYLAKPKDPHQAAAAKMIAGATAAKANPAALGGVIVTPGHPNGSPSAQRMSAAGWAGSNNHSYTAHFGLNRATKTHYCLYCGTQNIAANWGALHAHARSCASWKGP